MHVSLAFILVALPILTAAAPLIYSPVSLGVAVPISKRNNLSRGVVDPSELQSGIRRTVAKFERGLTAYERNTGVAHPLFGSFNIPSKRDTGSDSLTDDSAQLWYGTITVGTPAVTFTVDFDTGSSDMFLPSESCQSGCSGHTMYSPSTSSTAQDLGQTFSLAFGDGSSVEGEQYTDTVGIAGLTAYTQTLGAATQYSSGYEISQFPADGLLGMGFQSISVYNAPPPFQTLISEGAVTSPVFGFKLATSGSELFLGGTNSALYTGRFTWVYLTNKGFWQAFVNAIFVNGRPVLWSTAAIFDTGTTQILGDPASIAKLFNQISGAQSAGAGLYTIPCSCDTPISVDVGGKKVSISPASFNLGPVSQGSSTCIAGAASTPDLKEMLVLGDVFLQNVYTAWDVGNSRIGFATLA